MPTAPSGSGRTFISYARQDSAFALELTNHLRSAGCAVWIDQLDIQVGTTWDLEIQQALKRCPRLLVILSPASVSSNNVLDEVRYALDERKIVIPVLYRDCDIPFWLRRLQWVDVRSDRNGLEHLAKILRNAGQDAAKTPDKIKNAIALIDCDVDPPIGVPGDIVSVDYTLHNSSRSQISVWLRWSFVKDGKEVFNPGQDLIVEVIPGTQRKKHRITIGNVNIPNPADDVAQLIASVWYGPKSRPDQSVLLAKSKAIPVIILRP